MINDLPDPPVYPVEMGSRSGMNLEQKAGLQNLLQNYNPDSLADDDAKALVAGIRGLGIESSRALGGALNSAGIDPIALAEKAGLLNGNASPSGTNAGGAKGEINNEAIEALTLVLDTYAGGDLTDDDWSEIFSDMQDKGIDLSQSLLDIRV